MNTVPRKSKPINPTALKWFSETINWEVFQKISLHLYSIIYDDHFAEEYLVRGMFQDGIDIISFKKDTGKSSTLQCKYYQHLTLGELKEIVDLFVASSFLRTSDVFIVTTTASLQKPEIKKYIHEQIAYFRDTYDIQFDCWDVGRLETELQRQYLLVEHYFGPYEAERFCFEPAFRKIEYKPFPGYIDRNLRDVDTEPDNSPWLFGDRQIPRITLQSLFITGETRKQLVGIIAEAYEGKSTLFQQAAYELYSVPQTTPLLVDLKGTLIQPIENLLNIKFNTWKSIPAKNLVVLIDGLDEVSTEDIMDAIAHINDFATRFPSVRIAVSCRRLYYSNYNLKTEMKGFTFFELIDLHYGQIVRYADSKTSGKGGVFYSDMDAKGISLLLANPFYLVKLVGWYNDPKESIPETKVKIALKLIDESFNVSGGRKIGKGKQLAHNEVHLKKLLQQLALAFQINGTNACDDALIQELFKADDITLLKNSFVLDIDKGKWMFINNFFQEQLAAIALLNYTADEVISLITVGTHIRKINTKWIQTIATYLSMLETSNPDRKSLLEVIENDNIELIAKSEGSTFSPAFKLDILTKIINRSARLQSRLVLIGEKELADFIGNEKSAVNYLLEVISSSSLNITKEICCHVLKNLRLNQDQIEAYTGIAKNELLKTTEKYLARLLLEAISHYRTGDKAFLDQLLQQSTLLNKHEFRQGIYKYLEAHGLIPDYYDFVLEGLDVLYAHNKRVTRSGSELRLMSLLLGTDRPDQLKKLLHVISGNSFHAFFRFKADDMKDFLTKLQDILVTAYAQDKTLLEPVVDCVVSFGIKREDDEFRGMNDFFERTNTYLEALRIFLSKRSNERRIYDFSDHVTPDCFDFLIESCQSGIITIYDLNSFISGLNYCGKVNEAIELQQRSWEAFGRPDPQIKKKHDRYAKAAMYKEANDIKYISSPEAFEAGVRMFFKALKKEKITFSELYNQEDRLTKLKKVGSDLINHLMHEVAENQEVSLSDCISFILDEKKYRPFRVRQLMNNSLRQKDQVLEMLKTYYLETVGSFSFDSVNNDSELYLKILANQYLKIWSKYKFDTLDDVLLKFIRIDGEGLNFIRMAEANRRESVALNLVSHFEETNKIGLFKEQVFANLKNGINNTFVLGTHLELCKYLRITDAQDDVLKVINREFNSNSEVYGYMDIYNDLGGDLSNLLPLFEQLENFEDYLFIHMVKLLSPKFPEEVEQRLLTALFANNTTPEKKRDAARYLAELGNKDGFQYIIRQLDPQQESPYMIQSNWAIWNVDTQYGLSLLEPLIFTLIDDTLPKIRFSESVDRLVLEILNGFASKGESDLEQVVDLLTRKSAEFSNLYPNRYGHLLWYAQQMEEAFRTTNPTLMSLTQMKPFLAKILD